MAKVCPICAKEYGDTDLYCAADGTTLQPLAPTDDLIGSVIADRYLITDKIGEGGMGRVYLARHVRLPQNVAIKVLHQGMVRDPTVISRFRREAVNASQIENEHVARVFDHGEVGDGLFYIVMEYVEGESLSRIITREGALPLARAVDITRQVADALAAAHERPAPIVHRDLKPDTIMIGVRRDGTDRVKVVDFGIAEAMSGGGPKLTPAGLVIGTPEYMSPEQLSAITLDSRSDIYSLALVTFDMLTGHLPFTGESPHEAALMRLRDRPKTLADMKADVAWPAGLQAVMDRGLARAPAERYATAPEFAQALADAAGAADWRPAATAPTRVVTTAPQQRAEPERKRTRTAMVGSAVVFAAVALASVAVLVFRGRAGNGDAASQSAPSAGAPSAPSTVAGTDSAPPVDSRSPSTTALASPNSRKPPPTAGSPSMPGGVDKVASPSPAARADTTASSNVGSAATPSTSVNSARVSLDHVESLIARARTDTARAAAFARDVLDSARVMVPRLEARQDIVELGVYTVAAYLLLGRKTDACLVLQSIGAEAGEIKKFAAQVQLWNDRLDCRG
ncbi:MAG: protein kinase domain-containing protein [Myxococcales bacterium]